MINRNISPYLKNLSKKFPILAITGPRQSGKTTLVRKIFHQKPYVSLEDPDHLELAREDPRRFFSLYPNGAVLDEVQRVPDLFSYLQGIVDENQIMGQYILSGSQNFNLMQSINQSLAGRVALFQLLPFSLKEIQNTEYQPASLEDVLFCGFYPRLYDHNLEPHEWFPNYIQTYIERDVRQIIGVQDLVTFQRFLKICAGRTGQLINYSDLANDIGVSPNTVKSWINILETSYILFRLSPHYKNFNKRLTKSSKLYFWDIGLVTYLLGIKSREELITHSARGSLFETFIVSEMMKQSYNKNEIPALYFWRDKRHEIDLLYDSGSNLIPIEIKSATTVTKSLFDGLTYWSKLASFEQSQSYLIYGGIENQDRTLGQLRSWKNIPEF